MLRLLEEKDFDTVIEIVNENWCRVYSDYVNPFLISQEGCKKREEELKHDFRSKRLSEYVWEEQGQIAALLSFGATQDRDKRGGFEIWRIYVKKQAQGRGIGNQCLEFAEQEAKKKDYKEAVIWAFQKNHKAISFYEKNGYVIDKIQYLGHPYLTYGTRLKKCLIGKGK